MAKQKRARGRPKTTGTGALIGLRAQPEFLARVDKWRNDQAIAPSRPAAILHLATIGLAKSGH